MEGRKACSSSRKPLECLYIWEQLIQSKAIILQQAWKQVVPVTSTRCATDCFCIKPAVGPGPYRCFAFANRLALGLSGCISHHLNLEDRTGKSSHLWRDFCPDLDHLTLLLGPSPNPFPTQLSEWDWRGSFIESPVLPCLPLERQLRLCGAYI